MTHDAVVIEYMDGETQLPAHVQFPPDEHFTPSNPKVVLNHAITTGEQAEREAKLQWRLLPRFPNGASSAETF